MYYDDFTTKGVASDEATVSNASEVAGFDGSAIFCTTNATKLNVISLNE